MLHKGKQLNLITLFNIFYPPKTMFSRKSISESG